MQTDVGSQGEIENSKSINLQKETWIVLLNGKWFEPLKDSLAIVFFCEGSLNGFISKITSYFVKTKEILTPDFLWWPFTVTYFFLIFTWKKESYLNTLKRFLKPFPVTYWKR